MLLDMKRAASFVDSVGEEVGVLAATGVGEGDSEGWVRGEC